MNNGGVEEKEGWKCEVCFLTGVFVSFTFGQFVLLLGFFLLSCTLLGYVYLLGCGLRKCKKHVYLHFHGGVKLASLLMFTFRNTVELLGTYISKSR